jgi:hypothetical protein
VSLYSRLTVLILVIVINITTAPAPFAFEVFLEEDTLTLKADKAPLQEILRRIAGQGVTIKIDPQLNPEITADFRKRDIKQALDSILKPYSHGLIWKKTSRRGKSSIRLAEIEIFRPGSKSLIRRLAPPPANLDVVKDTRTGALYVRNELLLRLAAGISEENLIRILQPFQAEIIDSNSDLGIYRIRFPENTDLAALRKQLGSMDQISGAEPNYAYPVGAPLQSPQGMLLGNNRTAISSIQNNATIAILDSGIDVSAGLSSLTINSLDAMQPDSPISDTLGHGTQMAFIASGVIKPFGVDKHQETQNSIIPIRVFDDNGYTSDFNVIQSLDFALDNGARVVNMSWGSETRSLTMEQVFNNARSKGLILVASAGNEPTGRPVYPAAYDSVIAVGATDPHGNRWNSSNYGSFVSVNAPGFATLPVGHKGEPGLYAGTSISSALVAGSIAAYLDSNPSATIEDVKQHLEKLYN